MSCLVGLIRYRWGNYLNSLIRRACLGIFLAGIITITLLCLSGCDDGPHYAPVTEINTIESIPKAGTHQVTQGETLYEIAWRYGLDYRYLAKINKINPPYTIQLGQMIYLHDIHSGVKVEKEKYSNETKQSTNDKHSEPSYSTSKWLWPAKGRVINSFSPLNKGINIAGRFGEPVYAVGAGSVVYCGDKLRGYGNLIILKHNSLYLSAYAHNKRVFVREGDWVKRGQKIAEMGHTGVDKVMLHFEIRRAGKPIDPLTLLGTKL